jgi:hypothetical protein
MSMRIYLSCMECLNLHGQPGSICIVELEDGGLYRKTCERGHETITALQQQQFEVLFDCGVYAIVDGYYRDAISSFTSALERFYEFYIELECHKHGVDAINFAPAWKHVSAQSERQFGAFIFLFLCENGKSPTLLKPDSVKLRNAVIHKGKFPTREQAILYGQEVSELIGKTLSDLRAQDDARVQQSVQRHLLRVRNDVMDRIVGTVCFPTMLSLSRAMTEPQPNLREWMEHLRDRRARESGASVVKVPQT